MKKIKRILIGMLITFLMLGEIPNSSSVFKSVTTVEAATKIKLNKSSVQLYAGGTVKLKLKGAPVKKVKWSSSKKMLRQ